MISQREGIRRKREIRREVTITTRRNTEERLTKRRKEVKQQQRQDCEKSQYQTRDAIRERERQQFSRTERRCSTTMTKVRKKDIEGENETPKRNSPTGKGRT